MPYYQLICELGGVWVKYLSVAGNGATEVRFARFRWFLCGGYSSIAQWQSIRLLIEGLLVRVQLEEPLSQVREFFSGLVFYSQC